jgi:Rieske Fe-S protein
VTDDRTRIDRRQALAGAATVGVGLPLLAACAGGGSASDGGGSGSGGGSAGGDLGSTSDVPVGGGTVFADQKVVVTQPASGDFKAFSAVCTHQGCLVSNVDGGTINCPCHGSQFSIEDGSVKAGPAPSPLGEVKVTVKGGEISLA